MEREQVIQNNEKYFMNVFSGRYPLVVEKGEGVKLYDQDGREYIDFLAGIGVNALGYKHPELVAALKEQVEKVTHVSNLYYIPPQAELEEMLIENSAFDRVFFVNSGSEAVEAAIKIIRKYFYSQNLEKHEIITARKSFHGRTLGALAATGQEKYRKPFHPLPPGFKYVPYNDLQAVENEITDKTAAVMIEPVQGEGGVYPADPEYLNGLREICDQKNILLVFDEIQCGIGRTGTLFAYQDYNVTPDVITLAKGLGGGIPIGAVMAVSNVAAALEPGDHGSTFGGNHLATRAGFTTLQIIKKNDILGNVRKMGEYFQERLEEIATKKDIIEGVRGRGLMLALELSEDIAKEVTGDLFAEGFLVNAVTESTLRFLPPLIIEKKDIDSLMQSLENVLATK